MSMFVYCKWKTVFLISFLFQYVCWCYTAKLLTWILTH